MANEASSPVEILGTTTRIVMLAMAIAMVAIVATSFIVVLNERSTQLNADRQEEINALLQTQVFCIQGPILETDKALAELSILIARGLAALPDGNGEDLTDLVTNLRTAAADLENKLALRETSLAECQQTR